MPIGNIHTLGALVVGGTSAFNLDGITERSVTPEVAHIIQWGGGQVRPSYIATMSTTPMISATFTDVATALAQIGQFGMAFPQSTTITTVDAYFTKVAELGTRSSGAAHFRVRCNEGLIIPQSISWSQDNALTMTVEIHTSFDGTNAPFVYTDSVALPHTPSVDELFTGGKVSINGSEVNGVTGVTYNFGIQLIKERSGGEIYPTFIGIASIEPTIEIKTKEVLGLNTFGLNGTAQTTTDTVIYFQKIDENGTRVAAGSASHISLTIDDGMIFFGSATASNNASAEGTITIRPTYDGTNETVVIATNATIV